MTQLLVFELDGGTWSVADRLVAAGRMPHLASLVQQGARGRLQSIAPLSSPALWTTIYTGQPRTRHGVETFAVTSGEVRWKRLWDVAYEHGILCGVCGSLVTWPPYDVGGFMIPDIMSRDATTIPPQFAPLQEMVVRYPRSQEARGYGPAASVRYGIKLLRAGIRAQTMAKVAAEFVASALRRDRRGDTYWRRALMLQYLYADAVARLYRTYHPGLVTYHYHAADTLSHWYWSEGDETTPYRDVVPTAYEVADRLLGRFLALMGPETTVLLLSDHGFRASAEAWSRYKGRLVQWVEALGLEGAVTPTLLAQQHFLHFREPSRLAAVAELLRSVTFKETGEAVLSQVEVQETSLYFTPPRKMADGLTVLIPGRGEYPFEALFENTGQVSRGVHDPEGMVVLAGPAVQPGVELAAPSIMDVTPTALALLGLPLAEDMAGRVWSEALAPGLPRSLPTVPTYAKESHDSAPGEQNDNVLYARLRDLGYL